MMTLMLTNGQERKFSMIIKSYATLTFVNTVDNIFVKSFPKEVIQNVDKLNKKGECKLTKDHNSTYKLLTQLK